MPRALVLAVVCALLGVIAAVAAAPAAATSGRTRCALRDARIDEASGIARGIRSPGVLYAQNDSGDVNRFFALDARSCATAAVVTVTDARNVDWEDLAVSATGPGANNAASVWLADIGDNDENRSEVDVYRVAEPSISAASRDRAIRTARADEWRLRYPDGPHNAESFAVTPQGAGYIITKSELGESQVFRLPPRPDRGHVQTAQQIATIRFQPSGTDNPFGLVGELTATGAAFSRDGSVFAIRTYSDAFVWRVRDGDLATALRGAPTRVPLPREKQGEGIGFDGDDTSVLLDSEGVHTPVLAVTLPAIVATATAGGAATGKQSGRSVTTSPTASGTEPATPASRTPASGRPSSSANHSLSGSGSGSWLPGIIIFGLAGAGAIAWWAAQLRRPRR